MVLNNRINITLCLNLNINTIIYSGQKKNNLWNAKALYKAIGASEIQYQNQRKKKRCKTGTN